MKNNHKPGKNEEVDDIFNEEEELWEEDEGIEEDPFKKKKDKPMYDDEIDDDMDFEDYDDLDEDEEDIGDGNFYYD